LPIDVIERALMDRKRDMLLILAKALNFSWRTTMALLFLGAKDHCITQSELKQLEARFGRHTVKACRSVLEHYHAKTAERQSPSGASGAERLH